jgi:hypothetical protein
MPVFAAVTTHKTDGMPLFCVLIPLIPETRHKVWDAGQTDTRSYPNSIVLGRTEA